MRPLLLLLPLLFLPTRDGYGADRPTYEVASVKPNTSSGGMIRFTGPPQSATFSATNASLQILITLAYQVKPFQIEGANGWIGADRFDISAKPPEGPVTREQSLMMLQTLLEDRFRLAVHRTTKEVPIYALTASKGGLKIKPASEDACFKFVPAGPPPPLGPGGRPAIPCGGFFMGPNILQGGGISMSQLADGLTNILGRPVLDKTGFTGTFDVHLEFSREGTAPMGAAGFSTPGTPPGVIPDNSNGPTIFTALQEQLGLKLESQKGPEDLLVIDHAEKPSEN